MTAKIVVVGSFVYDLVVWLPYFPRRSETLLATDFKTFAGGKGFNQAVSARRCGAQVSMVGKLGKDNFGDAFIAIMDREGIEHSFVKQENSTTTSLGIPMINPAGDNSIIGVPRANTLVTVDEIAAAMDHIASHELLLIQNEIPLAASLQAAKIAHQAGLTVVYNPAPALYPLSAMLQMDKNGASLVDWFMPNEVETEMMSGVKVDNPEAAVRAGQLILSQGVGQGVVITLGSQGVVAVTRHEKYHIPSFHIDPVDPTGAGDAFCGAFATAIGEGQPLYQALKFANAAGALAVTQAGAEPSLPKRNAIEAMLSKTMKETQ